MQNPQLNPTECFVVCEMMFPPQRSATGSFDRTGRKENQAISRQAYRRNKWRLMKPALFLIAVLTALSFSQQLALKTYNRATGLASNYIFSIYQDHEGFMWFGTDRGVTMYDGQTFKSYSTVEGLSGNLVYCIYQSRDGAMWFGTYQGGVSRFDGKRFTSYGSNEGLSSLTVSAITEDTHGRMYFQTGLSLNVLHQGKVTSSKPSRTLNASILFAQSGLVFAIHDNVLVRVVPSNDHVIHEYPVTIVPPESASSISSGVASVLQRSNGEVWLGGAASIARLRVAKDGKSARVVGALPIGPMTYSLFEENDSTVWAGTRMGLYRIINKTVRRFGKAEGVDPEYLQAMCRDREGSLWLGTFGGGAKKLSSDHIVSYSIESGLPSNNITALFCDSKDNIWVGGSHFIGKIAPDGTIAFTNEQFKEVRAIAEKKGEIFVGTFLGLFGPHPESMYQRSNRKKYSTRTGGVSSIYPDEAGGVWVGTYGTDVFHILNGKRKEYTEQDGIPSRMVEGIMPGFHSVWLLSRDNGASRMKDRKFEKYSIEQGLPSKEVFCVLEDSNNIWFGTGGGLVHLVGGRVYVINESNGLKGRAVLWIGRVTGDADGLWIVTETALHQLRGGVIRSFGSFMLRPSANASITQALHRASDNSLWVGTTGGVIKVDLNHIEQNNVPPPIAVTSMSCDTVNVYTRMLKTEKAESAEALTLAYQQNNISIDFAGLSYVDEEDVRYRFRLEPLEDDWSALTKDREVHYRNLGYGEYTFRVVAVNANRVLSRVPATLSFRITPPFWKTWWFIGLWGVSLAFVFGGFVRYISVRKLRTQVEELEREREVQLERERISRDLHDNVGAQLANIISGLDLVGKYSPPTETRAQRLLRSLQQDARSSMLQLRETIWAIQTHSMTLDKFTTQVEEYSRRQMEFQEKVELSFESTCDASCELTPVQVLNCFRIVQEALTNCVKHAQAKRIWVEVRCVNDAALRITVKDDGIGSRTGTLHELNGNGVRNMKKRANELGGSFHLRSASGNGTEVRIEIPLSVMKPGTGRS